MWHLVLILGIMVSLGLFSAMYTNHGDRSWNRYLLLLISTVRMATFMKQGSQGLACCLACFVSGKPVTHQRINLCAHSDQYVVPYIASSSFFKRNNLPAACTSNCSYMFFFWYSRVDVQVIRSEHRQTAGSMLLWCDHGTVCNPIDSSKAATENKLRSKTYPLNCDCD